MILSGFKLSIASLRGVAPGSGRNASALNCIVAVLFAGACFLMGGSARPEVASLGALRVVAALAIGLGLSRLTIEHAKPYKLLLALACGSLFLLVFQLTPLPPGIANALRGHEAVAAVDAAAQITHLWRPLTLTPLATQNALWSLLVPIASLIVAIPLSRQHHKLLAAAVLAIGAASAFLALLQLLSDFSGPLYFYSSTNNGSAVGLFANRNHQAAFLACLPPLAFALTPHRNVSKLKRRRYSLTPSASVAIATLVFVVPLILITGSRMGVVLCGLGIISIPFVTAERPFFRRGVTAARLGGGLGLLLVVVGALVTITTYLQRSVALDRLFSNGTTEEMRLKIIPVMERMIVTYWPWGSGLGSFEKVYQIHEPGYLLTPSYVNHAHNDWLELLMTGGVPALFLILIGCMGWAGSFLQHAFTPAPDDSNPLRKAGLVILLILGLASLTDYPLRTPALSCLFVLAAVWTALPSAVSRASTPKAKV